MTKGRVYVIIIAIISALVAVSEGLILWGQYRLWSLAADAAIILALPVSSFLHETGHILFGAMVKIKAVPKFTLFGSSCCKLIPKTDKNLRFRLCFTAVGGLVVNFLLMILCFLPNYCAVFPKWLGVFAPSSYYLFFINFFPIWYGAGKSDGLVCDDLLSDTDNAKVMVSVLTVQAQILQGKPIREVDENLLFNVPQIQEDDESFIALTELRYEYFKAKGDGENAEKYRLRFEELKQLYL